MKKYIGKKSKVDHIAIAVKDIEEALTLYRDQLGMELLKRREIKGVHTGMKSAELDAGGFSVVLVQGTDPSSQVSRYIEKYGPGVQHVAVAVDNTEQVAYELSKTGVEFATDIIKGDGLIQIFTKREENSGMMFEFIQRTSNEDGFDPANIQKLFEQLETSENY